MSLYRPLEHPLVYNFIQKFLGILTLNRYTIERHLEQTVIPTADDKILDVGCGTGRYAALFGDHYFGIDNNPQYIEFAKRHAPGKFSVGDGKRINFPNDTFSYVISVGVFHHLDDETIMTITKEMKRVLRPGGRILLIDPVYPPKYNIVGYILFYLDRGKHQRTLSTLLRLLQPQGFRLLTANIKNSFPYQVAVLECREK